MGQPGAPLLLLGAVLGASLQGSCCGSSRHSLCYSYLKVSEPSQGLPQFLSVVHLDDHPIARYDILNEKTVPLVPWMELVEVKVPERMFRGDLEWISELNHQNGGLHTWQVDLGCELREDGSKRGFLRYGYDGMDFISFDKETFRWVAAQPQAEKVKEKWEDNPRRSQGNKIFLEETCIKGLQRYLSYKNETLKKTEPPVGKVTGKVVDDSLETLICQVFGFYPKEIQATWMKDGDICKYETISRNVAPNSDGTYYVWLSIEIDPKERNRFRCYVEHEGLQEPLILALKEEPATEWLIPVAVVASLILGAVIVFLIYQCWRSRTKFPCKITTHPDNGSQEDPPSPPNHGIEDETQSQEMLQPTVSSEHNAAYGGWRPEGVLEEKLFQPCPMECGSNILRALLPFFTTRAPSRSSSRSVSRRCISRGGMLPPRGGTQRGNKNGSSKNGGKGRRKRKWRKGRKEEREKEKERKKDL